MTTIPKQAILRSLNEFWLHVNFGCNLACTHCLFSCHPGYEGIPDLTLEQAKDYASRALRLGAKKFYVTGGEAFLWKPLKTFLQWLFANDSIHLTILTNGILITESWAKELFAYHKRGLEIRISLECYTEETNDKTRGKGSFSRAMRGIQNLNNAGIHPIIAFVNQSGGTVSEVQSNKLEIEFKKQLFENHGVHIAGLKVIGAYDKGELEGKVNGYQLHDPESMTEHLQCTYGLAASGLGLVPCPIVTDIPEAVINRPLEEVIGTPVELKYKYCIGCLATGSTCGQ